MAVKFPSEKWFGDVARIFNADDSYHGAGGGLCNCIMGIRAGNEAYLITFEGEECLGGTPAKTADLADADFYLDMPKAAWKSMVKDIASNGHATLNYTLNTLDLNRDEGLATSVHGDQYREDLFFRYNQTLQFYFDASARIKTSF